MRNLKLTISYDGSEFYGWQVQPERRTIQGVLAEAILRITGEETLPQGSGRTDAGVHALAQVASFCTHSSIPESNLRIALNDVLPASVRVAEVVEVPPEFHARRSARAKTYCYRIFRGDICPPFLARYVFHYPYPLEEEAMIAAASEVEGEHDFTSFAAMDPERRGDGGERSMVRTVFSSRWERRHEPQWLPGTDEAGDYELVYTVRGSGFLHHMVRNLVGAFLLAGKGTLVDSDFARILEARQRSANPGATAPPQGLYLVGVEY
jgi:tRNA pseudouridine38-40 synthase